MLFTARPFTAKSCTILWLLFLFHNVANNNRCLFLLGLLMANGTLNSPTDKCLFLLYQNTVVSLLIKEISAGDFCTIALSPVWTSLPLCLVPSSSIQVGSLHLVFRLDPNPPSSSLLLYPFLLVEDIT